MSLFSTVTRMELLLLQKHLKILSSSRWFNRKKEKIQKLYLRRINPKNASKDLLQLVVMLHFLERVPPPCMLLLVLKRARYDSLTDIRFWYSICFKIWYSIQVGSPLPHINIYIDQIHKGMHGSDTGAYDAKGRFVPQKFEEIFKKHAKVRPDALTSLEVEELILSNRDPLDTQSWGGPIKEWGMSYNLSRDEDGFLHKDSIRGIYDGSEFVKLEEKGKSSRSEM